MHRRHLDDPRPWGRPAFAMLMVGLLALSSRSSALEAGADPLPERLLRPRAVEPISAADFGRVLEHHRGKVILVNLWATWCIPCIQELPELDLLQSRYRERGLVVLAVSADDLAKLEARVRPFFAKTAPELVSYLIADGDHHGFVAPLEPEWLGALPTTLFFDREGKHRSTHLGRVLYAELESEVLELLEAPPTP